MAYSLALTDHYFNDKVLNEISQAMKSGKPRPNLPPEQEEQFINTVRSLPIWSNYLAILLAEQSFFSPFNLVELLHAFMQVHSRVLNITVPHKHLNRSDIMSSVYQSGPTPMAQGMGISL